MAASMTRVTVADLVEALEKLPENQIIGYVMTVSTGVTDLDSTSQCIMLHHQLPGFEM